MNQLWQDLRYGGRMLLKQPGFTLIAVLTLSFGIGANTVIFSALDALLLRPLPGIADQERIVQIGMTTNGQGFNSVSYADYPETFRTVAAKQLLDGVRDGLKGTDGKVVAEDETTVGSGDSKVVGRSIRIEAGNNAIRVRVFLVENRLYQVMVAGTKAAVDANTADEFLKSFDLLR